MPAEGSMMCVKKKISFYDELDRTAKLEGQNGGYTLLHGFCNNTNERQ